MRMTKPKDVVAEDVVAGVVEAARALLGAHTCARCHMPDIRPDYEPECVLRRALARYDAQRRDD